MLFWRGGGGRRLGADRSAALSVDCWSVGGHLVALTLTQDAAPTSAAGAPRTPPGAPSVRCKGNHRAATEQTEGTAALGRRQSRRVIPARAECTDWVCTGGARTALWPSVAAEWCRTCHYSLADGTALQWWRNADLPGESCRRHAANYLPRQHHAVWAESMGQEQTGHRALKSSVGNKNITRCFWSLFLRLMSDTSHILWDFISTVTDNLRKSQSKKKIKSL